MTSFSDLVQGPKMFADAWGPKWGPRYWRVFFTIIVLALAAVALSEIGGFGKAVVVSAYGWLFPAKDPLPVKVPPSAVTLSVPAQPPSVPQPPPAIPPRVYSVSSLGKFSGSQCFPDDVCGAALIALEKGKWFTVDGKIENIYPSGRVTLLTAARLPRVQCFFGGKWMPKLALFNTGDNMKFTGKIEAYQQQDKILSLQECELP
jgi:hypothetical protein